MALKLQYIIQYYWVGAQVLDKNGSTHSQLSARARSLQPYYNMASAAKQDLHAKQCLHQEIRSIEHSYTMPKGIDS